jgi:hypothetical protein
MEVTTMVLMIGLAIIISLAALIGWASIDAICDCVPLTQAKGQGVVGLFSVVGFVIGFVTQLMWG